MKTLVINLDRDVERMAHMRATFDRLGVPFERFRAIEPDADTVPEPGITGGEHCCYLSHRGAWARIVESGEPYGVVFEDDVHVTPSLARYLQSHDWIPADADLVKLETRLNAVYADLDGPPGASDQKLVRLRSTHYGTAGYVLSDSAARLMLALKTPPRHAVDVDLFDITDGASPLKVIYQVEPALCIQDDRLQMGASRRGFLSNIAGDRKKLPRHRKTLSQRLAKFARKTENRLRRDREGRRAGYSRRKIAFVGDAE